MLSRNDATVLNIMYHSVNTFLSMYYAPSLGHCSGYREKAVLISETLLPGRGEELVQCGRFCEKGKPRLLGSHG